MRGTPSRRAVDKRGSAAQFRHNVSKSHPRNVKMQPRRGGWRL